MKRKIVAGFASSLDGYIEGPNGEYDWILIDKEIDFVEEMKRFDTYFFGRKSYEAVIAQKMQYTSQVKNYVFSNSLHNVHDNFILIKGNINDKIEEITSEEGKDIAIFGGAGLLTTLLNYELVDEIIISVIPVLLGAGKSMVNFLDKRVWLTLINTHTYSNGTVQLFYEVDYNRKPK